jgi:hypothetical protein
LTSDEIDNLEHVGLVNPDMSQTNSELPRFFQNVFENGITATRNGICENISLNGHNFSVAFMGCMLNLFNEMEKFKSSIVFDSDIELFSWEGGFSDIILNIPSGSAKKYYKTTDYFPSTASDPYTYINFLSSYGAGYENPGESPDYHIIGWDENESIPLDQTVNELGSICVKSPSPYELFNESVFDKTFESYNPEPDPQENYFTFNSIVILYDIVNNGSVLFKDVPLGIYFTGLIDEQTHDILNPVTIYTSNPESYGAGSGWSLRICTRFAPTPHGYIKVEDVAIESDALGETMSSLMAANAELLKNINEMSQKSWVDSQSYRNLLAMFKNGRVNVPYPQKVNGIDYWFINGRNTEMPVYPPESE